MKKTSYITTTVAACLTGLAMSGCSDFLEPKALSEFVPKDATALNELLLGEAYPLNMSSFRLTGFTNLFDDDLTAAPYQ
ncbi:MAG: RagB/SusD family nutrient uptake outer membrane protein, partial [Duncaniella sp.]|nr:RagB/SusD family nutrient uptake outer membrane protein [Duncaniella sp.]